MDDDDEFSRDVLVTVLGSIAYFRTRDKEKHLLATRGVRSEQPGSFGRRTTSGRKKRSGKLMVTTSLRIVDAITYLRPPISPSFLLRNGSRPHSAQVQDSENNSLE